MLHGIWYKIEGLKQEISYSILPQVISWVFQIIWKNFKVGFIACFWIIIQLFFRLLASFYIYCGKNINWNLSRNWSIELTDILLKLGKDYFKSILRHIEYFLGGLYGLFYNNYPVTYSFIGVFLEFSYQNITWYLVQNWRIESLDILLKLGTGHFKNISSHIE